MLSRILLPNSVNSVNRKHESFNSRKERKSPLRQHLSETSTSRRCLPLDPQYQSGQFPSSLLNDALNYETLSQNSPTLKECLEETETCQLSDIYKEGRSFGEEFRILKRKQRKAIFKHSLNQALLYDENHQIEDAWSYINELKSEKDEIRLCSQEASYFEFVCSYLKGRVFLERRDFYISLDAFNEAAEILRNDPNYDPSKLHWIMLNIAMLHCRCKEGDRIEADRLLRESFQYGKDNNDNEQKALRNECDLNFNENTIPCDEGALDLLRSTLPEPNNFSERSANELDGDYEENGVSEMSL